MNGVSDRPQQRLEQSTARDGPLPLPHNEERLAMMRRHLQLSVGERIALLDQTCREQTRIAIRARRVR